MPPRNPDRALRREEGLARRVAHERDLRGWSYEGLAKRMTDAGCPINQSAIYRIEKGDPPRRITVDELVGLSLVFGIPLEQLLLPPELAAGEHLGDLLVAWDQAQDAASQANAQEREARSELSEFVAEHPDLKRVLKERLATWAEHRFRAEHRELAVAHWFAKLTGDPEAEAALAALLEATKQPDAGEHLEAGVGRRVVLVAAGAPFRPDPWGPRG